VEDQGKRLLIAVAIAFGVMLLWSVLFPPGKKKTEEDSKPGTAEVQGDAGVAGQPAVGPDGKPAVGSEGKPAVGSDGKPAVGSDGKPAAGSDGKPAVTLAAMRGEEEEITFGLDAVRVVFSSWGGGIKSWQLKGSKYEDRTAGGGKQIDLVPTGDRTLFPVRGTDLVDMLIGFEPVEGAKSLTIPADAVWTRVKHDALGVDYRWSNEELEVTKSYQLVPDEYLVKLTVTAKNLTAGEVKQAFRLSMFQRQDPATAHHGRFTRVSRVWNTGCYLGGKVRDNSWDYLKKGAQVYPGGVRWGGFVHSYFLAAVAVHNEGDDQSRCVAQQVADAPAGTMRVDVVLGPPKTLEKDKIYQRSFVAYLGPKYLGKIDDIDQAAGFSTGFGKSIDLGWFSFIARPLLWLLQLYQSWVVNWGLAIILLTITVKLATLYWTTKSMRSMRAMAKLKPQMEEIQKKYKADRQRQQQEIMALYKANKVNPLSGCLPMLLQMPIWFALYRALNVAAELYQAPFIPGWIDDLTAPDRYYVLPVALMVMMFVQARLTPTSTDSTQQKIMQYGLPLIFGFFGFFFPAGLTLYIFTNTMLSAVHGIWMRRTDPDQGKPALATAAAAATPVSGGGVDKAPERAASENKGGGQRSGKRKKNRR